MRRYAMIFTMAMLLIAGVCGSAGAQTPEELIAIRGAFDAALNAHDLDLMMTYWTDDAVWDVPAVPPVEVGKEAIRTSFHEDLFLGLPDFGTTEGLVLVADNIVVVEHMFTGTHQGEWLGLPATGKSIQVPHMDIYEFEGDKIKKLTTYMDNVGIMVQLGLMPAGELPPLVPSFTLPDPEPTGLSPLEADAELLARFNTLDLFEWMKIFHQDAVARYGSLGMIPMNRDEYAALQELNLLGFPDVQLEVSREVDMGEGWVLSEFVSIGTHTGPYFGIPASGNIVPARWGMLTRYDADGLARETNVYFDNLGILMQIGAIPAPEPSAVSPASWGEIKAKFLK